MRVYDSLTESQVKSSWFHQIVSLKRFLSSHFYVLIMSFKALFEDRRNQFAKTGKLFVMINLQSSLTVLSTFNYHSQWTSLPINFALRCAKEGSMLQRLQPNNILFTADK